MSWQHSAGHKVRESCESGSNTGPEDLAGPRPADVHRKPMCHPIWLLTAVLHAMTATICRSSPSRAHSLSARDTLIEPNLEMRYVCTSRVRASRNQW